METLTQVQEDAISYLHNSKCPNAVKTQRKASRMVRTFCQARGYSTEEVSRSVKDMFDVYQLQRDAQ